MRISAGGHAAGERRPGGAQGDPTRFEWASAGMRAGQRVATNHPRASKRTDRSAPPPAVPATKGSARTPMPDTDGALVLGLPGGLGLCVGSGGAFPVEPGTPTPRLCEESGDRDRGGRRKEPSNQEDGRPVRLRFVTFTVTTSMRPPKMKWTVGITFRVTNRGRRCVASSAVAFESCPPTPPGSVSLLAPPSTEFPVSPGESGDASPMSRWQRQTPGTHSGSGRNPGWRENAA